MPKSRKRKDHKKRVEKRNNKIKTEWERASKEAWKKYEETKKNDNSKENS
jgi:hypothetical protein